MPGDSNILLRIDAATKAAWQERARAEGQTLTGLIIQAVEGRTPGQGSIPVSSSERLGSATGEQAPASAVVVTTPKVVPVPEVEPQLGAVAPPVTVHPPLPAPAARVEPAPSAPAVAPPPRRAAVRGHLPNCPCLMCKG